ncbi:probable serine/threonine-protein kinase PBL25 [Andrographis paniculata]|uniref:probable serine/threonine-protein kinase PBL25 n=1 Tax=Andrographis paniculata TaxID=175694 RepID=UPI0021E96415|nr:probable serine/threonine-protein kinase PBL25 [Andrographis paniculata]
MGCFACFKSKKKREDSSQRHSKPISSRTRQDHLSSSSSPSDPPPASASASASACTSNAPPADANVGTPASRNIGAAKAFTFRELAIATKNFRQESLLSESGIGRVFKGTLQSNGQIVAVRSLDRSATQGSKEFQAEVSTLIQLDHPNLVKLIGYCADGDQRLLVYEYLPLGPLETRLFELPEDKKPLDWSARMKVALGVAEGLEYLHEKVDPPIIYCSLKSSNILLDDNANTPKLSEYGLAKLMQHSNKMNASPTILSAYGYSAPECGRHGDATMKSDVYSFGVVLLELLTGRRAYDGSRPAQEQSLVTWAKPFMCDPKKYPEMADPRLGKEFPTTALNQAVGVASMCIQDEPSVRPLIADAVAALTFLATGGPGAPFSTHLNDIDEDDEDDEDEDDMYS